MGRPPCCKRIAGQPVAVLFEPVGAVDAPHQEVVLALDEFEALRLAHVDGLYQEQAAAMMGVSRATFGRILASGQHKVVLAIVRGMALRIEGQAVERDAAPDLLCEACHHQLRAPDTQQTPPECPRCSGNVLREVAGPPGKYLSPRPRGKTPNQCCGPKRWTGEETR